MRSCVLLLVAGCQFNGGPGQGPIDSGSVDSVVVDGGCQVHALAFGDVCAGAEQPGLRLNAPLLISTTTGEIRDANDNILEIRCVDATLGGREVCALWLASLDIEAVVRVVGERPLVVVSSARLRVRDDGQILAGSGDFAGVDDGGPGAGPQDCAAAGTGSPGEMATDGDLIWGGGGGGGFAVAGAAGGIGNAEMAPGGARGEPVAEPTVLHGGCSGGDGGADATIAGRGGAGGGALYLAALTMDIRIDGVVSVAGQGGGGGDFVDNVSEGGGGGGGSGGMVVLDGNADVRGVVATNGGGGGEGAERDAAEAAGADGESGGNDQTAAAGGTGNPGSDGGNGGTELEAPTVSPTTFDGGGGGGGSHGVVVRVGG